MHNPALHLTCRVAAFVPSLALPEPTTKAKIVRAVEELPESATIEDAIVEYYERVGADDFADDFAAVFEEKVIEKVRPLEDFPRMGRMVPERERLPSPSAVRRRPYDPARCHVCVRPKSETPM